MPLSLRPATAQTAAATFVLQSIAIEGGTVFPEATWTPLVQPLLNRPITLTELRELAAQITQRYQDNNYITSRALVPAGAIADGRATIRIIEGRIARVDLERATDSPSRLPETYLRERIALGLGIPFDFGRLEDQLQLLRTDPLFADIRATLAAGEGEGESILRIVYKEAPSFSGTVGVDNYGNAASGIYQGTLALQEANLTGRGDRLFGSYGRSGNSDNVALGYQLPIGVQGASLSVRASLGQNPVTEPPFDTLNIRTESQVYELSYRQPLVRNPRTEVALSLGLGIERSNAFLDGQSFNFQNQQFGDGLSQATVLRFGQDALQRDERGAWSFRSTFHLGLEALGATVRGDGSPDGRFFYWSGQALRVQRLGLDRDTLLLVRLGAQLTGDRLLSLNRFSVGGPQSVRGYRQNQVTGDSGLLASLEFQLPIARDENDNGILKLLPFVDVGTVWNTDGSTVSGLPQTLAGVGLGLQWEFAPAWNLRVDYGIPLNRVTNATNNLQDAGLYFSISGRLF
ncbi:MAG: ShlB/FhaC/HecB family hemolysin secretion/activation protein [Pseudanabaenaceae cyanobacterium]